MYSSYNLFFLHSFKLKTEVTIDENSLLVTDLEKYEVIAPLHFHEAILPSHVAKCPFRKLQ